MTRATRARRWIAVVLALAFAAPAPARALDARSQTPLGSFGHGSWCWFADPRAVHVVGQFDETFAGWIDWAGRVTVGEYDSTFGVMRTHVIAKLFHDDHSAPSILVEPDQRLTVFYSAHNGTQLYYRSTLRPEDISAWGPVQTIRSRIPGRLGFTYSNPVLLPDEANQVYLFWRGADYSQDYAVRAIDGAWSPARHLIARPGERPYVKVASNGRDTIAFAYTNGHPRERITSLYYAAYRAGWLWRAGGRPIAPLARGSIAPRQGDLVYNGRTTGVSAWVWDVALDSHQRPVILYATFRSLANHAYWYAHFDGHRWVSHFMTFGGPSISPGTIEQQYSGGMALDHSDPSIVYLSRKVRGAFEVERWSTRNGGYSWHHETVVRSRGVDNVRPVVPRGASGGSIPLLWLRGHYGSYSAYRTRVAFLK
ncbi:MAG: BNR-4 repeat-containing protein [Solirubrobacteraceae bacterium]